MNILIYTYSVTHSAGGVFDAVRDLFTNKAFNSHHLEVLSYKENDIDGDLSLWRGITMRLVNPNPFLYSPNAKKLLLNSESDILHMEALWRYPQMLMPVWKKKQQKPIVCSPHGMLDPYIIKSQGFVKRIIAKLFFQKGLDAVTCYHALCQKELEDIRAYGLKQPVAIIPNGINLPITDAKYTKDDNKKHLLYLGRLHEKKGVDILLKAIVLIRRQFPELLLRWHFDLVGWDHENCRRNLEKIVADNNLQDIVTFHGGLFGEDKTRMYATSDAYILPSHGEGLPMTILEAWSWKLPVIMTPQCHIQEGYDANAAIRISDNIESVRDGIVELCMMSDEERLSMGNRGYKLVKEHFTWDASARKMIELYEWLITKKNKPEFVYE